MYWSVHTHSEYSAKDAMGSVKSIVDRAAELNYPGLALTDHGNIAGAVELYQNCMEKGIKPFPGCEMYLVESRIDKRKEKRYHFGVLAYTTEGYRNLVNLVNLSHQNFYRYPIVDLADLADLASAGRLKGLVVTTGCYFGYVTQTLINEGRAEARRIVKAFDGWFDHVFVEIQKHCIHNEDQDEDWNADQLMKIADELGLHIVLGQDSHYVHKEQQPVHDAMKRLVSWSEDPDDSVFPGDGFHMVDDQWMIDHHGSEVYSRAMKGHEALIDMWDMNIEEMDTYAYRIPKIVSDPETTLKKMIAEGLVAKELSGEVYEERIAQEMETITLAGMADYFILVSDVCQHMREEGIEFQTRGSAAGSLVAYLVGITNVDPIIWGTSFDRFMGRPSRRYNMNFMELPGKRASIHIKDLKQLTSILGDPSGYNDEWFQEEMTLLATNEKAVQQLIEAAGLTRPVNNPCNSTVAYMLGITEEEPMGPPLSHVVVDRKSPPDIDLDVDNQRRAEMIEWLDGRYSVVQIGNWMEMGLKTNSTGEQTHSDEGSVMVKYRSALRKKLTAQKKSPAEIKEALLWENIPYEDRQMIQEISDLRPYSNVGTHACGLILCNSKDEMDLLVPKMWIPNKKSFVSQFHMKTVESIGLVKLDLLGSKTVTVMSRCAKDLGFDSLDGLRESLNFKDRQVFAAMSRGKTEGVFQLEGYSSMMGVKTLKPKNIDDVIAAMALFRPQTMDAGATEDFMNRRFKREEVPKLHPLLQEHVAATNGIILYQDQIIDILRGMGMNPDDLTQFLKAVKASNKNTSNAGKVIEHYMPIIHDMCQSHGIPEDDWEWLKGAFEAATGYGFNKCLSGSTRILVDMPVDGKTLMRKAGANASTSKEMTLEEFYNVFHGPNTPTRKKYRNKKLGLHIAGRVDGRIKMVRIKDVFKQGVKHVWRVTLEDGKQITATADHRHLTSEGWKEVRNLSVGDELATMGEYESYVSNRNPNGFPPGIKNGRAGLTKWVKIVRSEGMCEFCESVPGAEIAHLDNNPSNHTPENIRFHCNPCHKKQDYSTGSRIPRWTKGRSIVYSKVVSIEDAGEEMTYDLEIDSEDHSWVGNGIVTHNSHATVYGITAYITQWLQIYHPDVFFSNCLTVHIDNPDKVLKYERAARERRVRILGADVVESAAVDYRVAKPGVIRRPLQSIKGVGEIAARCIEEVQPIRDLDDFLGRVNARKVTGVLDYYKAESKEDLKGVMKALSSAHALDTLVKSGG